MLVTIWNENSIERFDLLPSGSSLACAKKSIFLQGAKDFRPVAIDCDSRGNIFLTDWVLVDYPNHGRGRIWRVSTADKTDRLRPQKYFAAYDADLTAVKRNELLITNSEETLLEALSDDDPFLRHAAQQRLASDSGFLRLLRRLTEHPESRIRLGAMIAAKRINSDAVNLIRKYLLDKDARIRQAALMWAGESLKTELRPDLGEALKVRPVTTSVFDAYLAALQNLDRDFIDAFSARTSKRAKDIPREASSDVLVRIATDNEFPVDIRAMAISRFEDEDVTSHLAWLLQQLTTGDDILTRSIIRRIAAMPTANETFYEPVAVLALTEEHSPDVRCDALLALGSVRATNINRFLPLLEHSNRDIAMEAARTFRAWLDAGQGEECISALRRAHLSNEVKLMLSYARQGQLFGEPPTEERPVDNEAWQDVLAHGGNAERGRRVFFCSRVGCSKCHTVNGRGGFLGPDLSGAAQSKSRTQIVDAILDPSAEFPPQFQAWMVGTVDGRMHRGLQLDHKSGGAIELITENGEKRRFEADEIEKYAALPVSLMPSGLAGTMTVSEFRDLVAFLQSLGQAEQ